jgi:voltage-gated potassium channel
VKIIARADDNSLVEKFRRAGADYVVNPSFIGGLRMASQLLRPNTVTFLDRMLRGQDPSIRVDEAIVAPGSMLAGQTLAHARVFETTGLRPIAVRSPADETFHYNPDGSEVLDPGTVLIVIGNPDQLAALRRICGATTE